MTAFNKSYLTGKGEFMLELKKIVKMNKNYLRQFYCSSDSHACFFVSIFYCLKNSK